MDLIALGLGKDSNSNTDDNSVSISSSIIVFRTISWQKMFTISQSDLSSAAENDDEDDDYAPSSSPNTIGATHLTWSPDGRILAISLTNGSAVFYDIESCASPGVPPTPIYTLPYPPTPEPLPSSSSSSLSHDGISPTSADFKTRAQIMASPVITRSMTAARRKRIMRMVGKTPSQEDGQPLQPPQLCQIKSMHWQRIRKKHTSEWAFRKYYLDRSTYFLPQCHYTMEEGTNANGSSNGNSHSPKGETPLSILMVLSDAGLFLYLNGRYRIISHAVNPGNECVRELVSTSDFHILTSSISAGTGTAGMEGEGMKMNMCLYSIPTLMEHRYNLQFISYSYGAITSHLSTMKTGMEEGYSAWGSALRQLDMKFDQLSTLLIKYNVIQEANHEGVRLELLNYILGGHSTRSGDSSNAMDQFFTHPLMNDQLLIRLFRSLEANVAGVEGLLRKKILGPVRSLVYDVGELYGLVKTMNAERLYDADDGDAEDDEGDGDEDGGGLPALMDNDTCLRLCEASEILFIIAEQCVAQTVEIRHRLDCMTKWIRGTASQVKARGTAMDSVQRENARKRRVPEQVLRKVADFLSTPLKSAQGELGKKRGSTESILGCLLSDYFEKERVYVEKSRSPLKPKDNSQSDGFHTFVETPSLKAAFDVSSEISSELFGEPRTVMTKAVNKIEIVVEEGLHQSNLVSAIHSRFNGKRNTETLADEESAFSRSPHWTVFANTCASTKAGYQMVQIVAIPVGICHENEFEYDGATMSTQHRPSFYMTTFVQIPKGSTILNMKFYGDDGNSTLTSETSPSYEEGRQGLGLLLKRNAEVETADEELWLFEYDELQFRYAKDPYDESGRLVIGKFNASIDPLGLLTNDESMDDEEEFIVSKCKCSL